ncbi:MAG: proprotein convertase P-domain-containing protein, partial [Terrimicrobiaceae bacterium]
YTIAVGALSDEGIPSSYSEPGSSLTVSAPSGASGRAEIFTTDLTDTPGYNSVGGDPSEPTNTNYTSTFSGTSAACPSVAGVVALMLEANPNLTWYAVQDILIQTATRINFPSPEWQTNAAGLSFHESYGAGLVNALAAVTSAQSYPATDRSTTTANAADLPISIPENDPLGINIPIEVSSSIVSLQHAVLTLTIAHSFRGDLAITLTSPSGTVSRFTEVRGDSTNNYFKWPFMTLRTWGENPNGTWILNVSDQLGLDLGNVSAAELEVSGSTNGAPPPPPPPPVLPPSTVTLTIDTPDSIITASPGTQIKFAGTAAETTGIRVVEYAKTTFGNSENDGYDLPLTEISQNGSLRWRRISGAETWDFQSRVSRGINRFHIRATANSGNISNISSITIIGK